MGFLNNFSKSAKSFAEKAVKKTGEVAESAKLTISLKTEESKLSGLFEELGKLCYERADEGMIAAQILEIDEQKSVISVIKADLAENNGKVFCSACGKEISNEAIFCPVCGAKQEQKKNVTEEAETVVETKSAPEAAEPAPAPVKAEPTTAEKPLTAEEFIAFFKATVAKYKLAK